MPRHHLFVKADVRIFSILLVHSVTDREVSLHMSSLNLSDIPVGASVTVRVPATSAGAWEFMMS